MTNERTISDSSNDHVYWNWGDNGSLDSNPYNSLTDYSTDYFATYSMKNKKEDTFNERNSEFSTVPSSGDTIIFSEPGGIIGENIYAGSRLHGAQGDDHISLNLDSSTIDFNQSKKPQPDLKSVENQKYQEDKSMSDLSDYVSSTYSGHYTNGGSNVQTLDLIHSVGDAESFCRSNAIKYLSRYDKKGQAKRDILKAMHYCLLLYYFSGNTNNETPSHGYETF